MVDLRRIPIEYRDTLFMNTIGSIPHITRIRISSIFLHGLSHRYQLVTCKILLNLTLT